MRGAGRRWTLEPNCRYSQRLPGEDVCMLLSRHTAFARDCSGPKAFGWRNAPMHHVVPRSSRSPVHLHAQEATSREIFVAHGTAESPRVSRVSPRRLCFESYARRGNAAVGLAPQGRPSTPLIRLPLLLGLAPAGWALRGPRSCCQVSHPRSAAAVPQARLAPQAHLGQGRTSPSERCAMGL